VAAEIVAAVYFDTLSRWLIDDEPGFDLRQALNARLDLLLSGLAPADVIARATIPAL
jgi:hypothetical protein